MDPQALRRLDPSEEHVELTGKRPEHEDGEEKGGKPHSSGHQARAVGQAAHEPEQKRMERGFGRECEQERDHGTQPGGHDDPGQEEPDRGDGSCETGEKQEEGRRECGSQKGIAHDPVEGQADHEAQECCHGRSPGNAEHVGVGQGVAQKDLEQGARQGEQAADREGEEDAGNPELPDDGLDDRRPFVAQGLEDAQGGESHAAQHEPDQARSGHDGDRCRDEQEEGRMREKGRVFPSAGRA